MHHGHARILTQKTVIIRVGLQMTGNVEQLFCVRTMTIRLNQYILITIRYRVDLGRRVSRMSCKRATPCCGSSLQQAHDRAPLPCCGPQAIPKKGEKAVPRRWLLPLLARSSVSGWAWRPCSAEWEGSTSASRTQQCVHTNRRLQPAFPPPPPFFFSWLVALPALLDI